MRGGGGGGEGGRIGGILHGTNFVCGDGGRVVSPVEGITIHPHLRNRSHPSPSPTCAHPNRLHLLHPLPIAAQTGGGIG